MEASLLAVATWELFFPSANLWSVQELEGGISSKQILYPWSEKSDGGKIDLVRFSVGKGLHVRRVKTLLVQRFSS